MLDGTRLHTISGVSNPELVKSGYDYPGIEEALKRRALISGYRSGPDTIVCVRYDMRLLSLGKSLAAGEALALADSDALNFLKGFKKDQQYPNRGVEDPLDRLFEAGGQFISYEIESGETVLALMSYDLTKPKRKRGLIYTTITAGSFEEALEGVEWLGEAARPNDPIIDDVS